MREYSAGLPWMMEGLHTRPFEILNYMANFVGKGLYSCARCRVC